MNKKVFTLSAVMAGLLFGAAAHAADTRIGVTIYKYDDNFMSVVRKAIEKDGKSAPDVQLLMNDSQNVNQSLREGFVSLAGCRFAGGMVMSEYHRRRVEIQGALDHFPGIHLGAVNRAAKERLMGNKLILVVQIQHPELFPLKRGHMQPQPLAYGVGGSEGHPGLMQVAVQNAERSLNETPVLWRHLAG